MTDATCPGRDIETPTIPTPVRDGGSDDQGAWADVVATALVGTARRPAPAVRAPGPLGGALDHSRPADATGETAADLLTAATIIAAYREAGRVVPVDVRPGPNPAPGDDRPPPTPRAIAALVAILDDRSYAGLLPEWLALATAAGTRLPPELVPTVFDAAGTPDRAAAAALAGPLGAWLAERNEAWDWALAQPLPSPGGQAGERADQLEAAWAAGGDERRRAALTELRSLDAGRARALLEATWPAEPAAVKVWALDVLVIGLAPADEPLLESALDDRCKHVRRRAAQLLARLPGSGRAERMAALAVPLVRVEGRLRKRLTVDPPDEVDDAMLRDGVELKPPRGGERRWWLFQLVAGAPLAAWTEALGRSPTDLVALALSSDATVLLEGWAAASAAQGDGAWARALLAIAPLPPSTAGALAALLPDGEADAVLTAWIAREGLAASLPIVDGWNRPLSPEVSRALVAALVALVTTPSAPGAHAVRSELRTLALALHPAVAPAAEAELAAALDAAPSDPGKGGRSYWEHAIAAFGGLLHFRYLLHEEFR